MDKRTELFLDAMAHPGAAFVFQLASKGALTEDELLALVPDTSQATGNRRLQRLAELGVLVRAPGPKQYKDRPWALASANEADAFLAAALDLTAAVARNDEEQRRNAEIDLREGRQRRQRLRLVDDADTAADS
jgi:DNA-binding HxlR family transcriptional regulator